jgi:DNA-binding response OmpR family regulator
MRDPAHLRPAQPDQTVILVAEDEALVRNIVQIGLESSGYFVIAAADGGEALELSRVFPGTIHAVVSDIVMPNLDGVSLREQILLERPGVKVLLMSGTGADLPLKGIPFLRKPFQIEELKTRVRQLLAAARSAP